MHIVLQIVVNQFYITRLTDEIRKVILHLFLLYNREGEFPPSYTMLFDNAMYLLTFCTFEIVPVGLHS